MKWAMQWAWDPDKDEGNKRKHRISFNTAILVFRDPLFMTEFNSYPHEERIQTMGMVNDDVILVIHTLSEGPFTANTEAGRESSVRERLRHRRGKLMKKEHSDITAEQKAELEALAAMSDEMIDTSDVPETSDWSGAVRGLFFMSEEDQKEALARLRSRRTISDTDELTVAASD